MSLMKELNSWSLPRGLMLVWLDSFLLNWIQILFFKGIRRISFQTLPSHKKLRFLGWRGNFYVSIIFCRKFYLWYNHGFIKTLIMTRSWRKYGKMTDFISWPLTVMTMLSFPGINAEFRNFSNNRNFSWNFQFFRKIKVFFHCDLFLIKVDDFSIKFDNFRS